MKRILITGASGFVGSHLVEYMQSLGDFEIFGTVFGSSDTHINQLVGADHLFSVNLLNAKEVQDLVMSTRPEWVVHLAALSSPARSNHSPLETLTNNIGAQVNLLESLLKLGINSRTLIIGSAEEYGAVDGQTVSINEDVPLNPANPYAVSKISQDYLGLQYFNAYGLPIIRVRPFNHTGERHTPTFVVPSFAKQCAEVEHGLKTELVVEGDLEVYRDFTDVKDMVRAYVLALEKGEPGEVYNIGSGTPVKIADVLSLVLSKAKREVRVVKDQIKQNSTIVKSLVCDATKFRQISGWQPEIPLENTIERVLAYWRNQINEGATK